MNVIYYLVIYYNKHPSSSKIQAVPKCLKKAQLENVLKYYIKNNKNFKVTSSAAVRYMASVQAG